jgi:hypothetical protein
VDLDATKDLFSFMNPGLKIISSKTLYRDIQKEFQTSFEGKKADIQAVITHGYRLSLTTDCWSARNSQEYMAVTVHYSDVNIDLRSVILDIIFLPEANHDHVYLCDELLKVTDR